jgi:hypothetical protein
MLTTPAATLAVGAGFRDDVLSVNPRSHETHEPKLDFFVFNILRSGQYIVRTDNVFETQNRVSARSEHAEISSEDS